MVRGPGSWFPVHGAKQYSAGTPGQVSCSEMQGVLSFGMVTN